MRTHYCGRVDESLTGKAVTVAGWAHRRRDHGGVIFVDLRDREGLLQIVFDPDKAAMFASAERVRNEFVLKVTGLVRARPPGTANPNLKSGQIEVLCQELEILNRSEPLPFQLDETVSEEVRLRFRYLDLRREEMRERLLLRHRITRAMRQYLDEAGFVDIETPMLSKATPEGARDYLVPSRTHAGKFFALPQSPQIYKQLLMISGFDRYYQIVRCFRDEDLRADRQPEFTQLDIETSFLDQAQIQEIMEGLVHHLFKQVLGVELPRPMPRISYAEAMRRFGSDKPDMRLGLELVECTEFFSDTTFRVFQAPYVGAVVMPGGASQPRRTLDGWQEWAKQRGHRGLAYVLVGDDDELAGPVAKNLSDTERDGLAAHVGASPGDCIFFSAGPAKSSRALLGAARIEIGHRLNLIDPTAWAFVWVVDPPLFEPAEEATAAGDVAVGSGAWTAVHHAFTSPKPAYEDAIDSDPGGVLADAYDIVCNGNEIGGGSIRIHRRDIQERVFAVMGLDKAEAEEKFGFLLEAFMFGAPPHGGIAFGWDRINALLSGVDSIREVIAFPKTGGGVDPLTDAPAPITAQQRKESGIDAKPKEVQQA